jgi:hypothetical protein
MLRINGVSVGDLPSVMVFLGGPRSGTNHFRLELASYASLLSAFFVGSFQVRFALFRLELLPSRDCEAHSAGKRSFASYAKRHLLQLDMSLRLLDAAAFNRCILTLSLDSRVLSWHPGDFWFHRFGRRFRRSGPWRTFLVLFHISVAGAQPRLFFFLSCPVPFGWES